jgi:hypothetical protein
MEQRAAATAAYVLDARAVLRDVGGKQIRDFDLVRADGSVEPLEVTMAADQITRHTWARVEALDRDAPTLTRAWTLGVPTSWPDAAGKPKPFNARDFLVTAEPLLAELERLGITEFDTARWVDGAAGAVVSQLVVLGCDLGLSHEIRAGETGRIYLGSGPGGFVDPNSVAEAIEVEAAKPDNIAKLREPAIATRRHLFVVVDGSTGGAFSAANHGELGRVPVLRSPITTAWVGASTAVHVATPPDGWISHLIPEEVFEHAERWTDLP